MPARTLRIAAHSAPEHVDHAAAADSVNAPVPVTERLIVFEKLEPLYGIPFGRVHVWRLMRDGRFPLSVKTSEGGRAAWLESESVAWIRSRPRAITVQPKP